MDGDVRRSLEAAFERAALGLPHEAEFLGVEIVAHRARRNGRTTELVLTVDRAGGADLALCERLAWRVNALLQSEAEPYTLEVESPGLDRQLARPEDYERFRGENVRVFTTLPIEQQRTHRGRLLGLRGNAVLLATPQGEFPIPLEMVKSAKIEYDYRADLKREKRERRERR